MNKITPAPNFDNLDYESLNKFLSGTLRMVRTKEITIEEADVISKVSDKIIKNNLTMLIYRNKVNKTIRLPFFEEKKGLKASV